MREKLKMMMAFFCILLFLPYICAVLFHNTGEAEQTFVNTMSPAQPIRTNDIEQLLIGVVAAQISPDCELEIYKAQMVLSRTALYKMLEEQGDDSLDVEQLSQYMSMGEMERRYGSEKRKEFYQQLITASKETAGVTIKYQGKYIESFFYAVSSGKSRDGNSAFHSQDYGYLKNVENPYDILADNYVKVIRISKEELSDKINTAIHSSLSQQELLSNIEILQRDEADYVSELTVAGQRMAGEEFRHLLDLNSSCFYLEEVDDSIQITTKGLGHGIGMSQYNANELAKEGKSYQEILSYYFHDIELVSE